MSEQLAVRAADYLLHPTREAVVLSPPRPRIVREAFATPEHAQVWFTAEHAVLLAAVEHAATTGYDVHTWQLACRSAPTSRVPSVVCHESVA